MMKVINQTKEDAMLKQKYGKQSRNNMSKTVGRLYKKYQKKLQQPVLNARNLIKAMRYIKKHDVKQKDYGKVLSKLSLSKANGLSQNDYEDIYKTVCHDCGTGVSYVDAQHVLDSFTQMIAENVHDGNKVRLGKLGHFDLRHTNGRHYSNRSGHGVTKPHYYPHFVASAQFKRYTK